MLAGAGLGILAGAASSYVALSILDAVGVTSFVEDEPLHGLIPFLITIWTGPVLGAILGGVLG